MTPKICEGCELLIAKYVMSMIDSVSMDNLWFVCRHCVDYAMKDWMNGETDTEGWEIRKI